MVIFWVDLKKGNCGPGNWSFARFAARKYTRIPCTKQIVFPERSPSDLHKAIGVSSVLLLLCANSLAPVPRHRTPRPGMQSPARQPWRRSSQEKNCLTSDAEVAAAEMMLDVDLAARTETADQFHVSG